jgi:hypothetical protein
VRRYPGSRRNPQFGAAALERSVAKGGLALLAFGTQLGGRRAHARSSVDPRTAGWRSRSFAAYAEHMASTDFDADALLVRGWQPIHLLADGRHEPHFLSPHAVVEGGRITYPAQPRLDV